MSNNTSYSQREKESVKKDGSYRETYKLPETNDIVDNDSWWENPPLNPIEDALINGKTIAYYIPSEDADSYKFLALQSLGQWVELLKDKKELSKEQKERLIHPKYEFVIGKESPGYNGDMYEHDWVIINFRGSARLG